MRYVSIAIYLILLLIACSSEDDNQPEPGLLQLSSIRIGPLDLNANQLVEQAPIDKGIVVSFNLPLDVSAISSAMSLNTVTDATISLNFNFIDSDQTVVVTPTTPLLNNTEYELEIKEILGKNGERFNGGSYSFKTEAGKLEIISATINNIDLLTNGRITGIDSEFRIEITFSQALDVTSNFENNVKIGELDINFEVNSDQRVLNITNTDQADDLRKYTLLINQNLTSAEGFIFEGFQKEFYTQLDSTFKFPEIPDEELLTKVQEQTFNYFWDFAHPVSGLARERNTSGNLVTIGGSGFGVMAILVGIERGFIS
ncbi:MAG: Ig-like domain-containing protein, partial [Bacteroidota bacterium]